MSFSNPNKAIPSSTYSRKVIFKTERTPLITDSDGNTTGGKPIADQYILSYKLSSASDDAWISYVLSSEAEYVFIDNLDPVTLYDAKWNLRGELNEDGTVITPVEESESDVFTFVTAHNERFIIRPPIPSPLVGTDFTSALQIELDEHINYINTVEDELAIERFVKEGVGKIGDPDTNNCKLMLSGGGTGLFISNGYFQSGSGLDVSDARWYPGARFWEINDPSGYLKLDGELTNLPTGVVGDFYGYMGAYIEEDGSTKISVIWSKTFYEQRPDNRWLIGRVKITDVGIYSSVDISMADYVPSLQYLATRSTDGGGGSGGGTGGSIKLLLDYVSPLINLTYEESDGWTEIVSNKTFNVESEGDVVSFVLFSDLALHNNMSYRIVIDSEAASVKKERYTASSGVIFVTGLATGEHTVKIEVISDDNVTINIDNLILQVIEQGLSASSGTGGTGIKTGRNIIYNPQNPDKPSETIYENVEAFKVFITKLLEDKIKALTPGQSLSIDNLIANIGRGWIGQGEDNPPSLLRIDGGFVIPEVYGQDGINLTVDGEEYGSPIFEGEGNLEYDEEEKAWVV